MLQSHNSPTRHSIMFLGADARYLFQFRGNLMRALVARGYQVYAVAPLGDNFDVDHFRQIGAEFLEWPVDKVSAGLVSNIYSVYKLARIVRRIRPRILFAHTIKAVIVGLVIGRLLNVPRRVGMVPGLGYAFQPHGTWRSRYLRLVAVAGYRIAFGGGVAIFQNSDDFATLQRSRAIPRDTEICFVAGSGVDLDHFDSGAWPSGPPTFLFMARLIREKGVYDFIHAARVVRRSIPDSRFIVAGGLDRNPSSLSVSDVETLVKSGLVDYRGHVDDPTSLFHEAHVFVLPSYYMEGCPRVNLEAMAASRAVITTDWVGCRETVQPGTTGLLVPIRNAERLADAMSELGRNLERARAMGIAGRQYCTERFDIRKVEEMTIKAILGLDTA